MVIPRESAMLPTVKCSSCSEQIPIVNMGEHICTSEEPPPSLSEKYRTIPKPGSDLYGDKYMPKDNYGRAVATGAANQPFMPRGRATSANSSSESRSTSLNTPGSNFAGGHANDPHAAAIARDYDSPNRRQQQQQRFLSPANRYGGHGDTDVDGEDYMSTLTRSSSRLERMNTVPLGASETGRSSRRGTASDSRPSMSRGNEYGGSRPPSARSEAPERSFLARSATESVCSLSSSGRHSEIQSLAPVATWPRRQPTSGRSSNYGDDDSTSSVSDSLYGKTSTLGSESSMSVTGLTDTSGFDKLMDDLQSTMDVPPHAWADDDHYASDYESPPASPVQTSGPTAKDRNDDLRGQICGGQGTTTNPFGERYGRSRRNETKDRQRQESSYPAVQKPTETYGARNGPSRGRCKACGLAITGKSISSADGRLTGRYHKDCFVCARCSEPFSSAEFYVHDDRPYCHVHYHKLNGSLCGTCGRGIEGQYLEDEALTKYHYSGCFCCDDCNRDLIDGYFELNGKAYCERHAQRRADKALASSAAKMRASATSDDRDTDFARSAPSSPNLPSAPPPKAPGSSGTPYTPKITKTTELRSSSSSSLAGSSSNRSIPPAPVPPSAPPKTNKITKTAEPRSSSLAASDSNRSSPSTPNPPSAPHKTTTKTTKTTESGPPSLAGPDSNRATMWPVAEPSSGSGSDSNRLTVWPAAESAAPRALTRSPTTVSAQPKPGHAQPTPGLQRSLTEKVSSPKDAQAQGSSRRPSSRSADKGVPPPRQRNGIQVIVSPPPPLPNRALLMQRRMTKIGMLA